MVRSGLLLLTASLAAGVAIHRTAYWDGWHKGVAHGRELGMTEARRQLAPHKVTFSTDAVPVTVGFANQVPVGAMLPEDWLRA